MHTFRGWFEYEFREHNCARARFECDEELGLPEEELTESPNSFYIVHMTTLTITDAKKNLGKWLTAAVKGEDIGILAGATVVALRPVEVEATDYAWREYGVTPVELDAFIKADNARIEKARRKARLITLPNNLEDALEKITGHRSRRAKAASRTAKRSVRKRPASAS
jgi:antitoxin (DNA-binding transcriptional repressor) of toxin-antitoxin stability system